MAEPSKDRDKAVEEALEKIERHAIDSIQCGRGSGPWSAVRFLLNLLWQRAQEAERARIYGLRCGYCRSGQKPTLKWGEWLHPAQGGWGSERPGGELLCASSDLRQLIESPPNTRAARASEEPKP